MTFASNDVEADAEWTTERDLGFRRSSLSRESGEYVKIPAFWKLLLKSFSMACSSNRR